LLTPEKTGGKGEGKKELERFKSKGSRESQKMGCRSQGGMSKGKDGECFSPGSQKFGKTGGGPGGNRWNTEKIVGLYETTD